jgi:mannose-1-phosphate guanylyltransferase/mannose-1-phosphate guanylyltransferase/mannose-6-phosphate isomerase
MKIVPVILAGGIGSRLWPLSRQSLPKPLLRLAGANTLLQDAVLRVGDRSRFAPPIVVANLDHRFIVAEQLQEAGAADATILLEPVPRGAGPALAAAALVAAAGDEQALLLVQPADRDVRDHAAYLAAIAAAARPAQAGSFVLLGLPPGGSASTVVRAGEPAEEGTFRVGAFSGTEAAPADGRTFANSGIVVLPARGLLDEMALHAPEVLDAIGPAVARATRDLDFLRMEPAAFAASPCLSIDAALLRPSARTRLAPAAFDGCDLAGWSSLWSEADKDGAGNVALGDAVLERSRGSYVRSEGPLVAVVGVEDLVVVATPDAVLVTSRQEDQAVGAVVERLRRSNHDAADHSPRVYRPWGWYETIDRGERFQVKRITVKPGAKLSLQKHVHRAEHWVVVNGAAAVEVDGRQSLLGENQGAFIPPGAVHRLSNPGKLPLNLIEVQSGAYLGEDDIVRLEDEYARA